MDKYINGGLVLMNLKKMRSMNIQNRFIDYIRYESEWEDRIDCHDQDVINVCCRGRISYLDKRWDVQVSTYCGEIEQNNLGPDAFILHYIGVKPWIADSNVPYREEYLKYFELSPWNDQNTYVTPNRKAKYRKKKQKLTNRLKERINTIVYHRDCEKRYGLVYKTAAGIGILLDSDYVKRVAFSNHKHNKSRSFLFISFSKKRARKGSIKDMAFLAFSYLNGSGVKKDEKCANYWINKLIENDEEKIVNLIYLAINDINSSNTLTIHLDDPTNMQLYIGRSYRKGLIVDWDLKKAALWLRMASDGGSIDAEIELCDVLYEIGMNTGKAAVFKEMFKRLEKDYYNNIPGSASRLARSYLYGLGVKRDSNKALELSLSLAQSCDEGYIVNRILEKVV